MTETLQKMMLPDPISMDTLFGQGPTQFDPVGVRDARRRTHLTLREERALTDVTAYLRSRKRKAPHTLETDDIVVDVAKSAMRHQASACMCPCVLPNSKLFRVKIGRVLSPLEVMGLQCIWQEDFPRLTVWAHGSPAMTRDLAGNAFTGTVFMAVSLAACLHAYGESAPMDETH